MYTITSNIETLTMPLCQDAFTNEGDSISNVHIESLSSVEAKPLFSYCQHLLIQLHNINMTLEMWAKSGVTKLYNRGDYAHYTQLYYMPLLFTGYRH